MSAITIMYTFDGKDYTLNFDENQNGIANDFWSEIVVNPRYEKIKGIKPDGSVVIPKHEAEKCFAVQVVFAGCDKKYTYGSNVAMNVGEEAVVSTWDGMKIVQVVDCAEIDKTALPKMTNGAKPQWIKGKFTRF